MANIDASTPQLKLINQWIDAYASRDASKIAPLLSKDYKHQTFPESIGEPDETKEGHVQRFGQMGSLITKLDFIVRETIEAPGKVVVHATSICTLYGTTLTSDSVAIISLVEEDGELKLLQCKEFSDPQRYNRLKSILAAGKGAPAS